jgi:hypothetical protein
MAKFVSKENLAYYHSKIKTPLNFAQEEYNKSKNLFDGELLQGVYIFDYGYFQGDSTFRASKNFINVKGGQTITLSFKGNYDLFLTGFVFYNNGTWVGKASNTLTATVPANANQVVFNIFVGSNTDLTDIQLEYGSTATDYQPYNGEIVHKGDISVLLWTGSSTSDALFSNYNNYDYLDIIFETNYSYDRSIKRVPTSGNRITLGHSFIINLNGKAFWCDCEDYYSLDNTGIKRLYGGQMFRYINEDFYFGADSGQITIKEVRGGKY